MNYSNPNIDERAQESGLWNDLTKQDGRTLPRTLERYLLLKNYDFDAIERPLDAMDELRYLRTLVAELATVALNQEERLRMLEKNA